MASLESLPVSDPNYKTFEHGGTVNP